MKQHTSSIEFNTKQNKQVYVESEDGGTCEQLEWGPEQVDGDDEEVEQNQDSDSLRGVDQYSNNFLTDRHLWN